MHFRNSGLQPESYLFRRTHVGEEVAQEMAEMYYSKNTFWIHIQPLSGFDAVQRWLANSNDGTHDSAFADIWKLRVEFQCGSFYSKTCLGCSRVHRRSNGEVRKLIDGIHNSFSLLMTAVARPKQLELEISIHTEFDAVGFDKRDNLKDELTFYNMLAAVKHCIQELEIEESMVSMTHDDWWNKRFHSRNLTRYLRKAGVTWNEVRVHQLFTSCSANTDDYVRARTILGTTYPWTRWIKVERGSNKSFELGYDSIGA